MAKLNIKFNSGDSYSFDTKTAKEKTASVQKEMQNSSPRPSNSVTQILIRDLAKKDSFSAGQSAPVERGAKHIARHEGTTIQKRSPSRVGDVLSGAAKTYAGTSANGLGTVISGTKLAREVDTQQWSNEAARYAYEMNNAADEQERAYWKMQLNQVSRNIVNAKKATERSDAGAQRVFDTADKLTDSGSRDISTAKAGMGKFGQLMPGDLVQLDLYTQQRHQTANDIGCQHLAFQAAQKHSKLCLVGLRWRSCCLKCLQNFSAPLFMQQVGDGGIVLAQFQHGHIGREPVRGSSRGRVVVLVSEFVQADHIERVYQPAPTCAAAPLSGEAAFLTRPAALYGGGLFFRFLAH